MKILVIIDFLFGIQLSSLPIFFRVSNANMRECFLLQTHSNIDVKSFLTLVIYQ